MDMYTLTIEDMHTLTNAGLKEIPKLVSALILLGLAWFVGNRLSLRWNLRQKQREGNCAGFSRAVRRVLRYLETLELLQRSWRGVTSRCVTVQLIGPRVFRRRQVGIHFGAIGVRREVNPSKVEVLGQFRQLYQRLRVSIEKNKPLAWNYSEHPRYLAFKRTAPKVASLIVKRKIVKSNNLPDITSNKWENWLASVPDPVIR